MIIPKLEYFDFSRNKPDFFPEVSMFRLDISDEILYEIYDIQSELECEYGYGKISIIIPTKILVKDLNYDEEQKLKSLHNTRIFKWNGIDVYMMDTPKMFGLINNGYED